MYSGKGDLLTDDFETPGDKKKCEISAAPTDERQFVGIDEFKIVREPLPPGHTAEMDRFFNEIRRQESEDIKNGVSPH